MSKQQVLTMILATLPSLCCAPAHANKSSLVGKVIKGHVSSKPMTAAEVTAMPQACINIGMGRINGVFWHQALEREKKMHLLDLPENAMARNAPWFHHYCWGLLSKFRIYSIDKAERKAEIGMWRSNMQFIIEYVEKQNATWAYLPLIHTEIAESHLADRDFPMAVAAAEMALILDKTFEPAYMALANAHERTGNKAKALDAIKRGLMSMADAPRLKKKYTELGGRLPYPEPEISGMDQTPPPPPAPADPPSISDTDSVMGSANPSTSHSANQIVDEASQPDLIPTPKPHCRFCPQE